MQPLEALPLKAGAMFEDLVFRPHPDGHAGHLQALHLLPNGATLSVTRGGMNFGTEDEPYEAYVDEEIHAPLSGNGVTELLARFSKA